MRFVWIIVWLVWLLVFSAPVGADPGDSYSFEAVSTPDLVKPLQKRKPGFSETPQVTNTLQVSRFANGLGNLADMVIAEDGSLYLSESNTGRIIRLSDRDKDGRLDTQRAILSGLNAPSGLAIHENRLFVADMSAVWAWDMSNQTHAQFVSLGNIKADTHRPLLIREKENALWLGLSKPGQTGEIISIDLNTKQARKISQGPGPIGTLSANTRSPVWIGISQGLTPFMPGQYGTDITALENGAMPGDILLPDNASLEFKDQILATQTGAMRMDRGSSGGLNMIAISTQYGRPTGEFEVVMDGFVSSTGRMAWGEPDQMAMDERGIFVSDAWNGTIWRIHAAETPVVTVAISSEPPNEAKDEIVIRPATAEEAAIFGSSIGGYDGSAFESQIVGSQIEGSQIDSASKLETGSTIVKAWEVEQAARDKAKAKSNEPED